jgi:uncharacterized protein (TIGR02466 family)
MNIINSAIPIFPEAVVYASIVNNDSNKILEYCKKSSFALTGASEDKTESNNCFITEKFNVLEELNDLKNTIKLSVEHYLYKILKYKMDFKFLNSWVTKTSPGGFSQPHVHCNTFLSGVYYPMGHENFKISFLKRERNFWDIETTEENEFNLGCLSFNITHNNTLLLFPSSLKHRIEKNESSFDRYSIAFNINPKGMIGKSDTKIFF